MFLHHDRNFFLFIIVHFSICPFVSLEDSLDGHPDDAQVEVYAPVLDVPDVSLHTPLHLPKFTGLTAETCYLSPTGDTGLDKVAHHIFVYQFVVLLSMSQHVRPWPHDAHVSKQHVPELWQFVDVGLAHEITKGNLRGSSSVACRRSESTFTCMERNL